MKTQYTLIDSKGLHPRILTRYNRAHIKMLIFLVGSQIKISPESASAIKETGGRAECILTPGQGAGTTTLRMAPHLEQRATQEPEINTNVISKNTGFEFLVQYLKGKRIYARHYKDISELSILNTIHELFQR